MAVVLSLVLWISIFFVSGKFLEIIYSKTSKLNYSTVFISGRIRR